MSVHVVALLIGLFGIPGWLTWYGHRLRGRSGTGKAVFWGVIIGHTIATIALTILVLAPPLAWTESPARELGVYWLLLGGSVVGAVIGRLRAA